MTPEGFRLFDQRLDEARNALEEAWNIDPTDPRTAQMMIQALKGLGGAPEDVLFDVKLWFDRGIKADPDNRDLCEELLDLLDPKWHGSKEKMLAFARECAKTANVCNRIGLLIGNAHMRISQRMSAEDRRRRISSRSKCLDEFNQSIDRYFLKVADDRTERSQRRDVRHRPSPADPMEAHRWFERSKDAFEANHVHSMKNMVENRERMRQFARLFDAPKMVEPKRWFKLSPAKEEAGQSPDRAVAQWAFEQEGRAFWTSAKHQKPQLAANPNSYPKDDFKLVKLQIERRTKPIELPTMANLPNLETLTLSWMDLRPAELKRIGKLPALRTLEAMNTPAIDDAALVELVRIGPDVTTLSLERTAITDEGLRHSSRSPAEADEPRSWRRTSCRIARSRRCRSSRI